MGKLKVSFTTALFVFSFLVCVIVAVVFVDRGPRNDNDSFYEGDRAGEGESADREGNERAGGTGADAWERRKQGDKPAPSATPAAEDASLADLPLDPHLVGAAQTVPATPAPVQPTANPHVGKSPEQIAREMMTKGGVAFPQATPAVPGMAIPGGIATPAQQTIVTVTPQTALPQTNSFLPLQSNVGGPAGNTGSPFPAPGGFTGSGLNNPTGLMTPPSLTGSTTNMGSGWDSVTGKPTPSNMIGVRGNTGSPDAGMMISRGKSETATEPPLGFEPTITKDGTVPAFPGTGTGAAGSGQAPLLFPPDATPPGGGKWDLPAAPTLRPPPIQDPDQRRSDADAPESGSESPDSTNPDGSSGQALAVSGTDDTTAVVSAEPDAIAARVNEKELTEDQAARLAQVAAKLKEETVTPENRQEKITEAVRSWTMITAAAEQARKQELNLSSSEVDRYAEMRPDFEIDDWKKGMAEVGFTKAEIELNLGAIALSEKLVEEQLEQKYPEEELRKVYEKTPKEFYAPRQVQVMEIFKAKPEDEKQAKRLASEMSRLQRQAAGGTDFGLLARTTSQAPSKSKGGNLGWITPEEEEKAKPELVKAVADLKPGQVSGVLESEDGYRIYKLVAEKEARDDFEGAKELVVEKLKKDLREDALADAREEEEVELSPKKEIKVAESKSEDEKAKESSKAESKKETPAKATVSAPRGQRPIQQAAATGQLLFAPGTPVEQRAGGAPAPPVQPGGQPPVQQRMATAGELPNSRGYAPGQTMTVGENSEQPAPDPAVASAAPGAQNYATPLAVGTIATPVPNLTPEQQALQLRAMQARRQQDEQQQNAEIDAQMKAAQAYAARQVQAQAQAQAQDPGLGQDAGSLQPLAQQGQMPVRGEMMTVGSVSANPPDAPGQPVTTHSNGWQVTRREITDSQIAERANARRTEREGTREQAPSEPEAGIPPGFEGNIGNTAAAPASSNQQPQQAAEPEQERGGLLSGVKNLFSRGR